MYTRAECRPETAGRRPIRGTAIPRGGTAGPGGVWALGGPARLAWPSAFLRERRCSTRHTRGEATAGARSAPAPGRAWGGGLGAGVELPTDRTGAHTFAELPRSLGEGGEARRRGRGAATEHPGTFLRLQELFDWLLARACPHPPLAVQTRDRREEGAGSGAGWEVHPRGADTLARAAF